MSSYLSSLPKPGQTHLQSNYRGEPMPRCIPLSLVGVVGRDAELEYDDMEGVGKDLFEEMFWIFSKNWKKIKFTTWNFKFSKQYIKKHKAFPMELSTRRRFSFGLTRTDITGFRVWLMRRIRRGVVWCSCVLFFIGVDWNFKFAKFYLYWLRTVLICKCNFFEIIRTVIVCIYMHHFIWIWSCMDWLVCHCHCCCIFFSNDLCISFSPFWFS